MNKIYCNKGLLLGAIAFMLHTVVFNKIQAKYSISVSILKSTSAVEATVS